MNLFELCKREKYTLGKRVYIMKSILWRVYYEEYIMKIEGYSYMKPPPGCEWKMKLFWREISNICVVNLSRSMGVLRLTDNNKKLWKDL